ncbi:NtaA/DmoA family FMN-dependent monooxygenase [Mycolicibacterium wolinskyi]|uniref:Nitrilotriacetate monooxygenase n=1 Tax=Mycolicibacterium wolinskyi TaxID=59750 RepID=A0A1X2EUF4_9MYCO|nr:MULTISPECIES: NtaA/DmoA family FMN-dependent monooxygenase [Mycolicibacterium]MCV7287043.1 NtaA/DmoA family FMN-dependent monooxygenase [Mycolicibacterium wolinskyi]MCV7292536.1 NtaA/DmoA family FMN-dependent monooxygenase [Mycolicibacterium goodii]ORX09755.1 nitrilotriacetate monooxygenase [Mycolicibacterium wolinskyi]
MPRELHLLAFGNTRSAGPWRHPDVDNSTAGVRRRLFEHARTAEAGTFDALFFADGLNYGPPATWAYKTTEDFEPLTTTAALSSVTESIGLVVTGSATLAHPYHLARQLLSLDHLSGGRAGWNLVTSFARAAADNFSADGVRAHDERYLIAGEALEVVRKLWDGWGEDTIVEDRAAGIFNDVNSIRPADHHGRYFDVAGPIGAARSPQGRPVLFQAGSSDTGRTFAATHAEVIFTSHGNRGRAEEFYRQIHQESRRLGRSKPPLITPSLRYVVGSTDEEARRAEREEYEYFSPEYQAGWLLEVDVDVTGVDLDGPVPASAFPDHTETHQTALAGYRHLASDGNPSVREFLYRTVNGWGAAVVGTPERIADEIEEWFTAGAADGFVLRDTGLPGQSALFVEQVVPVLRKRGLFRHEYIGTTLRSHLGLDVPQRPER